jgi:peroxiredoxin
VVLIYFWTTWDEPYSQGLLTIEKLYPELKGGEVELLTITGGESVKRVQTFLHEKGYAFPVLRDAEKTMKSLYKLYNTPTTIVIDRTGIIRFIKAGPVSEEELRRALMDGDAELIPQQVDTSIVR